MHGGPSYAEIQTQHNEWRRKVGDLVKERPFRLGTYEFVLTQQGNLISEDLKNVRAIVADPDKWLTRF